MMCPSTCPTAYNPPVCTVLVKTPPHPCIQAQDATSTGHTPLHGLTVGPTGAQLSTVWHISAALP
eukprot:2233587-Amphidinium_carterae.1